MDDLLTIRIIDKFGNPLPGAEVSFRANGELLGKVPSRGAEGRATLQVPAGLPIEVSASFAGDKTEVVNLPAGTKAHTFQFDVRGRYSPMKPVFSGILLMLVGIATFVGLIYLGKVADMVPLALGGILLAVSLALGFMAPNQTPLQQQMIRSMFALALGGLASAIPGILDVKLSLEAKATIAASGAIAVWLVTYFFAPAKDSGP